MTKGLGKLVGDVLKKIQGVSSELDESDVCGVECEDLLGDVRHQLSVCAYKTRGSESFKLGFCLHDTFEDGTISHPYILWDEYGFFKMKGVDNLCNSYVLAVSKAFDLSPSCNLGVRMSEVYNIPSVNLDRSDYFCLRAVEKDCLDKVEEQLLARTGLGVIQVAKTRLLRQDCDLRLVYKDVFDNELNGLRRMYYLCTLDKDITSYYFGLDGTYLGDIDNECVLKELSLDILLNSLDLFVTHFMREDICKQDRTLSMLSGIMSSLEGLKIKDCNLGQLIALLSGYIYSVYLSESEAKDNTGLKDTVVKMGLFNIFDFTVVVGRHELSEETTVKYLRGGTDTGKVYMRVKV